MEWTTKYEPRNMNPGAANNANNSQLNSAGMSKNMYTLWHNRMRHPSDFVHTHIICVKPIVTPQPKPFLIFPLSKFTKLPYTISKLHASKYFELVHIDTWGPTKSALNTSTDTSGHW